MRKAILVAGLLAGCATHSNSDMPRPAIETPALRASIEKSFDAATSTKIYGVDYDVVRNCVASSFLTGIPAQDLQLIETSLQTGKSTPNEKAVVAYWFGPSAIHGIRRVSDETTVTDGNFINMKEYADGTPFDSVGEERIRQRVHANASIFCPAMVQKYPNVFGA